jgi:legumain
MKNICLALALFCIAMAGVQAAHYAVLVAGSNYYYNYRHQADIFHAYQLLKGYGFAPENIITMAYDDIANDSENPFPGQVFNKPSLLKKGKDVYAGVQIDYKGADVNSTNFLAVLRGDSAAVGGKKVLKTTAEDNVFVYFADHGAPGLIAFPADDDYLYADDLLKALNYMHDHKMYKEMVLYIEACESGSMFENLLPTNISIYATTAANSEESSWGTYCAPNDRIFGKSIGSCLGDLYSVNFLENLESVDPSKETLLDQFNIIKNLTTKSHVMQFGDLTIDSELIGNFEASNSSSRAPLKTGEEEEVDKYASLVDSRYNKLHYLQNKHMRLQSGQSHQELANELESIERFDNRFETLATKFDLNLNAPVGIIDFTCLKTRVAMYNEVCGSFSDYGLKYVRHLHYSCVQGVDIYDFEEALIRVCA